MSKKNFSDNPALAYISNQKTENNPVEEIKYKPNPEYIETKSKRVQLLMQPTVFNTLKEYANEHHTSVNETVNMIIKDYLNIE